MARQGRSRKLQLLTLFGLLILVLALSDWTYSFSQGPNNRNVSVDTTVNITGSAPEILGVTIESPITLVAGGLKDVTCNSTIRDYNGYDDLSNVNGTLFSLGQSSLGAADDNNTHYTNSSCAPIAGQESGNLANYTCLFEVSYYAINDSWNCTIGVNDTIGLNDSVGNTTLFNELLALNVTTLIDYGDLAIGDTSDKQQANVSNLGNKPINVSVRGYGAVLNDGLSFICEQGDLSVDLQHFAANGTSTYSGMQVLSSNYAHVFNMTVPKSLDHSGIQNTTWWQLFLDPNQNAFGTCNGTIVFQAESSN